MLTQHENELMEYIWKFPEGLTHVEMLENDQERSWRDSTVHLLINGLLRKGVIKVVGKRPSGRRHSRIFAPAISREEYLENIAYNTLVDVGDDGFLRLFMNFVAQKPLSKNTRQKLLQLLHDMEATEDSE